MKNISLSAVIPCYNEVNCVEELVIRTDRALKTVTSDYEVVLIDDGSTDGSWDKMLELKKEYPKLFLIKLTKNHGHQLALTAGLAKCHGAKYVFVLDADLQDPPELLPEMMVQMIENDADVIYGRRIKRDGESWFKLITAAIFYRLLLLFTDTAIPVDTGDFRLLKRDVVDMLNRMPEHARFIRGMVSWYGGKQLAFPYHRQKRFSGKTKYPLYKMIRLGCDAIISFSTIPLKFCSRCGCLGCVVSILLFIYVLYSFLFEDTVRGWTSIVATILFIGSLQFFMLGIIGEYLGRIFFDCQKRPLYLIEEEIEPIREVSAKK